MDVKTLIFLGLLCDCLSQTNSQNFDSVDLRNKNPEYEEGSFILEGPRPSGTVLFDVSRSDTNHVIVEDTAVEYDEVHLNIGGGYDAASGIFRCPKDGIYYFTFTSLPMRGVQTDVALFQNEKQVTLIHSVLGSGTSQLATKSALVRLSVGDEVTVRLLSGRLWSRGGSLSFIGFFVVHA